MEARIANPRERVHIPELLKEVALRSSVKEKVELLQAYANKNADNFQCLKVVFQCLFHPDVKFDLPEGTPPFTDEGWKDYSFAPRKLKDAIVRNGYFMPNAPQFLKIPAKRERVFVQLIEGLYKDERDLYIMMKDKQLNKQIYPTITDKLVRKAFPEWLPEIADPNV